MNTDLYLINLWNESRTGNLDAYGKIHQHLFPKLFHYLRKIVNDEDLVQDLIQDLFVKLWERKETLGEIKNVKFYFFKAARSLALNHFKSEKQCIKVSSYLQDSADIVFSREDILMQQEDNEELSQMIVLALQSLPKRQQEMIFLKYYQSFSYLEISSMTGIKYQSVVNHIHRAVLHLRGLLAEFKHCAFPQAEPHLATEKTPASPNYAEAV